MRKTGLINVEHPGPPAVLEALRAHPASRPAMMAPEGPELTYGGLLDGADRIAGQLATLGLRPGHTAASVLPNGLAAAHVYLGTLGAGRAAPLNPRLTPREIVDYLVGVEATMVVTTPDRVTELDELPIDIPVLGVEPRNGSFELTSEHGPVPVGDPRPVVGADGALVLLTSGTTGTPKRVSLTHENLLHAATGIVSSLALDPDDCGLLLMPQFHIHGLQAGLLAPLLAGSRLVMPPGFDAFSVRQLCATYRVSWYTAVPAMHSLIADRAAKRDTAWTDRIRFARSSSAAMPARLHAQVEALLDAPLIESYGMTECAHQIASNPLPPEERVVGSVGVATGVEIRIAEGADNRGEVLVRGRSVTAGYEAVEPSVNERAFEGGWFHTGDEGLLDEQGRLTLTGRLKELINRGGEKIRPKEVEDVIITHPAVKEVAVFALPHDRLGEEVAAVVVPNGTTTVRELREHARRDLAAFKVPRRMILVDDIPRGATGKVQRSRLAEQLDLS